MLKTKQICGTYLQAEGRLGLQEASGDHIYRLKTKEAHKHKKRLKAN